MRKVIKDVCTPKDMIDEDKDYLGYVDFAITGMKEMVLTIDKVQIHEVTSREGTENKKVLIFKEISKGVIMGGGKRAKLARMFGDVRSWAGKKIKLVADPHVRYKGKETGGFVIERAE